MMPCFSPDSFAHLSEATPVSSGPSLPLLYDIKNFLSHANCSQMALSLHWTELPEGESSLFSHCCVSPWPSTGPREWVWSNCPWG